MCLKTDIQILHYVGFLLEERGNENGLGKHGAKHLRKILRLLMSLGTKPKMLRMIKVAGKHLLDNVLCTGSSDDDDEKRSLFSIYRVKALPSQRIKTHLFKDLPS